MSDKDLPTSETSEVEDDDAPEDVNFTASRSSARQQREQELWASKVQKQESRAKKTQQQAWFHEQKVRKLTRPKKSLKKEISERQTDSAVDEEMNVEERDLVDASESPRNRTIFSTAEAAENEDEFPDFISLDKSDKKPTPPKSNITIKKTRASTLLRPEAVAFAKSRFDSRIRRIPASALASITAKRAATSTTVLKSGLRPCY